MSNYLGQQVTVFAVTVMISSHSLANARNENACFSLDEQRKIPFSIIQQSPPPRLDSNRSYPQRHAHYPASAFATTSSDHIRSEKDKKGVHFKSYYFLWANRCIFIPGRTPSGKCAKNTTRKGNPYSAVLGAGGSNPTKIEAAFSTYAKADACTIAQLTHVLGYRRQSILNMAKRMDLAVLDRKALTSAANVETVAFPDGERRQYLIDTCVLPPVTKKTSFDGVVLDHEVQDGRSPLRTLELVRALRGHASIKTKEFIFYTNPVNDFDTRNRNGISPKFLPSLLRSVTGFSSVVYNGATVQEGKVRVRLPRVMAFEVDKQFEWIKSAVIGQADAAALLAKYMPAISLLQSSVRDGLMLRQRIDKYKFKGVILWSNYARRGGSCSEPANRFLNALFFKKRT